MVEIDKRQIIDILMSIIEACSTIDESSSSGYRITLLTECQEAIISIGENLESRKNELDARAIGEGAIVNKLEQICEYFFCLSNEYSSEIKNDVIVLLNIIIELVSSLPMTYRVVFLPYKADMWDSFDSVWRAFKDDPCCEVDVVPIPFFEQDRTIGQMLPCYEGSRFPDYVNVRFFGEYKLDELKPDIAFVHNPFDEYNYITQVHTDYFSEELKKHCKKLVYIPYYVNGGYLSDKYRDLPLMYRSDIIVLQNEKMRSYASEVQYYDRTYALGSPKFDNVIRMVCEGALPPEAWGMVPHNKLKLLLNTSIQDLLSSTDIMWDKLKNFFGVVAERDDIFIIWRPHPLLESAIKAMRPQYLDRYQELKKYFLYNVDGVVDDTPDSALAVAVSDAYIGSNYSSIIASFMAINRPCLGFDSDNIYNYSDRDINDRITVEEAFVSKNEIAYFLAYEQEKYQFNDFIDDIKNNRLASVLEREKGEFARISANTEGTCGRSVHDLLMSMM